jgi:hypothetical protein
VLGRPSTPVFRSFPHLAKQFDNVVSERISDFWSE